LEPPSDIEIGCTTRTSPAGATVAIAALAGPLQRMTRADSRVERRRNLQPRIAALAEVASEFGTVRVVAPDAERSASGPAITPSRPLSYRQTRIGRLSAFRVNGTPADCVALGSHHWDTVDLVDFADAAQVEPHRRGPAR
jgi:hypothetical protein